MAKAPTDAVAGESQRSGFSLVPAAYVLLLRGSQVLMQLRQNTGFMDGHWACAAAGHVEPGESALTAALREATEEIGVTLDVESCTPLTTLHRSNGGTRPVDQRVDFFFSCTLWEDEPSIQEPTKCAGLRWFELDQLPRMMPEHERYVLEHFRNGTLTPIASMGFGH